MLHIASYRREYARKHGADCLVRKPFVLPARDIREPERICERLVVGVEKRATARAEELGIYLLPRITGGLCLGADSLVHRIDDARVECMRHAFDMCLYLTRRETHEAAALLSSRPWNEREETRDNQLALVREMFGRLRRRDVATLDEFARKTRSLKCLAFDKDTATDDALDSGAAHRVFFAVLQEIPQFLVRSRDSTHHLIHLERGLVVMGALGLYRGDTLGKLLYGPCQHACHPSPKSHPKPDREAMPP